jgi:hypothetical protein
LVRWERARAFSGSIARVVEEPVAIDDVQRFFIDTVAHGQHDEAVPRRWPRVAVDHIRLEDVDR